MINKISKTRKEHSQQTKQPTVLDGKSNVGISASSSADTQSPRKIEPKQPTREGKVVEDTIQSKRKELEKGKDTCRNWGSDEQGNLYHWAKGKLEGFNLGVSLAQKEFLELINKFDFWEEMLNDKTDEIDYNKIVRDKLKQSLEVKE